MKTVDTDVVSDTLAVQTPPHLDMIDVGGISNINQKVCNAMGLEVHTGHYTVIVHKYFKVLIK